MNSLLDGTESTGLATTQSITFWERLNIILRADEYNIEGIPF
jgi:hypothetical protein